MKRAKSFDSLLPGIFLAVSAAFPVYQKAYPVVTLVQDGVKTITNPDYPRDGRFNAKLTEEMSCGEEAQPEAAMLNKPLDLEGRYLSSFPFKGYFRSLAVDAQNRLYLAKWGSVEEPKLSTESREIPYLTSIFRTDDSGKDMVHLTDFLGETMVMKAMSGGGVMSVGGMYMIIWNVNPQGKLYGGLNENYRLNAYGTDGKIEFTFGREFTPLKNPRYTGQVGLKKTLPALARTIVFDDGNNLWLELHRSEGAKGYTYDVFSPEGIYLKQIKIDQRIYQFKNDKVYSLVRPEDGFPSIKRFRMDLTPEK
jgi:hypothetical protein